ncbi:MAG: hypothetical protein ABW110_16785 [Steroidobacteraceae bacterium]
MSYRMVEADLAKAAALLIGGVRIRELAYPLFQRVHGLDVFL